MRAGVVTLALWLAVPLGAHAADAGHHGPDWGLLGLQILNSVILIGILARVTQKPLADFLKRRSEAIGSHIREAESGLEEARSELAAAREKLARHEEDAESIRNSTQTAAEAERERGRTRAAHASERIREEARAVADQEIERARRELRREASELAVQLAADLLRRNLRPEDDERMVSEFADQIVSGNGSAGGEG